jgi:hypothetical protein
MERQMKKVLLVFWILTAALASGQVKSNETSKKNVITIDQIKTEPIYNGFSFKLHSNILNEDRTIMIALPGDYKGNMKKYSVLYMVDGQYNFENTAQIVNILSNSNNSFMPPMILVGIHTGNYQKI